jgi:hypothetical protein
VEFQEYMNVPEGELATSRLKIKLQFGRTYINENASLFIKMF